MCLRDLVCELQTEMWALFFSLPSQLNFLIDPYFWWKVPLCRQPQICIVHKISNRPLAPTVIKTYRDAALQSYGHFEKFTVWKHIFQMQLFFGITFFEISTSNGYILVSYEDKELRDSSFGEEFHLALTYTRVNSSIPTKWDLFRKKSYILVVIKFAVFYGSSEKYYLIAFNFMDLGETWTGFDYMGITIDS